MGRQQGLLLTMFVLLHSVCAEGLYADSIELQTNAVPLGGITVAAGDADRDDWGEVPNYELDPAIDAGPEIDYVAVFVANDDENVYFRFGFVDATPETPEWFGSRHNVYLDIDRSRDTGFIGSGNFLSVGADYLLQGPILYEFAGADQEQWGWNQIAVNPWDDSTSEDIETLVPIELIEDTPEFDFILNGANTNIDTEDFYPDNATGGEEGEFFTYELGFVEAPFSLGDFNGDDAFSTADIDQLVQEIAAGTDGLAFDMNSDRVVDQQDLNEWLAVAGSQKLDSGGTYSFGDANLDGKVDAQDLNSVGVNWQQSPATWSQGDFTADGMVGPADLNLLGLNWRSSAPTVAVPEPSTLTCTMFALLLSLVVRRPAAIGS